MLMLPSSRISRVALIFTSLFVSISIFLSGRYIWVNNFRWTRYGSLASPAASKPSEAFLTSPQAVNFPFPKKIWQTGPSMDVNTEIRPLMQSWYRQNPDFRYELLNDIGAENYVREHYENNSRVLKAYFDIPDIILRVDLLRYMIMAKSGGVYSDLDTKCLTPVDGWIAEEQFGRVSVVVGVEIDMSHDKVSPEEQNRFQLCQWTLMAMPGSRHFEAVVEFIVDRLYAVAEQKGVRLADLGDHLGVPEVITTTGPIAFTNALFSSLSKSLNEPITKQNVTGLHIPHLVDDVLFLPVNAFAGHQQHSHSGEPDLGPLFVKHYFRSSWWSDKGGRRKK